MIHFSGYNSIVKRQIEGEKGAKLTLKIMAENFPNMERKMGIQIHNAQVSSISCKWEELHQDTRIVKSHRQRENFERTMQTHMKTHESDRSPVKVNI